MLALLSLRVQDFPVEVSQACAIAGAWSASGSMYWSSSRTQGRDTSGHREKDFERKAKSPVGF
jgi:hypothetical protein